MRTTTARRKTAEATPALEIRTRVCNLADLTNLIERTVAGDLERGDAGPSAPGVHAFLQKVAAELDAVADLADKLDNAGDAKAPELVLPPQKPTGHPVDELRPICERIALVEDACHVDGMCISEAAQAGARATLRQAREDLAAFATRWWGSDAAESVQP